MFELNKRVQLFDFGFNIATNVEEVAAQMMYDAKRNSVPGCDFVITPNAYTIVKYNEAKTLKEHFKSSAYILPDGMPIVWLSKLVGNVKLPARICGSDLFPALWRLIKVEQMHATLIVPQSSVAKLFKTDYLLADCIVPPFFSEFDDAYIQQLANEVVDCIEGTGSRFVFLGLAFPKQEKLGMAIERILQERKFKDRVLVLLLGASYEFYFGIKARAPMVFRKLGLEWLHRFLSEPGRLWNRYTIDNAKFLGLVFSEIIKSKNA